MVTKYIRVYSYDPMTWKQGVGFVVMSMSLETIEHHQQFAKFHNHLHQTFEIKHEILYLNSEIAVGQELLQDEKI